MVDELIREITEPEEALSTMARDAARERLLLAAEAEARVLPKRRLRRRGLLVLLALVTVPTGVAVATELGRHGDPSIQSASSCPGLLAAAQDRGIETEALFIAECPVGAGLDQTVSLLETLQQRRAELGGEGESIGVVGGAPAERSSSADGSWGLWGIAGSPQHQQPQLGP